MSLEDPETNKKSLFTDDRDIDRRRVLRGVAASSAASAGVAGGVATASAGADTIPRERRREIKNRVGTSVSEVTETVAQSPGARDAVEKGWIEDATLDDIGEDAINAKVEVVETDDGPAAYSMLFVDTDEGKLTIASVGGEGYAALNTPETREVTADGCPSYIDCGDKCCKEICECCTGSSCGRVTCCFRYECQSCDSGWL